jgi:methylenetetrahydrofolate reductase (NADPH)
MSSPNEVVGDGLKQEIMDFLEGYSIETTPHDEKNFDEIIGVLPIGTRVYVAHPPGSPIDDVVKLSIRMKQHEMNPVPHIISRKLSSRDQLARALSTLRGAGIDEALVIAGDISVDDNVYESSIEVLETGLFAEHGFREIGVAGHPEGSKAIGEERVAQALAAKLEFAKTAPFKVRLVTQFGFDGKAVTDWEAATSAIGVDLPIHVGMAGPASLRQLAKFAVMCGVGASGRMLLNRAGATANLLRTQGPDPLIVHFARHRAASPDARIQKAHIFAFGGVAKSARWINAARAGRFEFKQNGQGFDIIKD